MRLYVETLTRADQEALWQATQDPSQHRRRTLPHLVRASRSLEEPAVLVTALEDMGAHGPPRRTGPAQS
ncbi:hypothetical protein GCM10022224_028400 [Nonomuraea antimicrobica]|uniref:Uncharacterized protein n=1 Tax=Nonomuraea antimicrobica TaxID=561173 RepID=A0ABP7BJR4_9ACTN